MTANIAENMWRVIDGNGTVLTHVAGKNAKEAREAFRRLSADVQRRAVELVPTTGLSAAAIEIPSLRVFV